MSVRPVEQALPHAPAGPARSDGAAASRAGGAEARRRLRSALPIDRLIEWDRRCTRSLHRASSSRPVLRVLQLVSRLADGVAWYVAMAVLALAGVPEGLECAVRMAASGLAGVAIVHWTKHRAARARPCDCLGDVRSCARALDEFSFPSGHTLHAVAFSTIVAAYYPLAGIALLPFIALVALSRVVLGLHYPSDVLAGAAIGATLALIVLVV